jgi:hypothetical protein
MARDPPSHFIQEIWNLLYGIGLLNLKDGTARCYRDRIGVADDADPWLRRQGHQFGIAVCLLKVKLACNFATNDRSCTRLNIVHELCTHCINPWARDHMFEDWLPRQIERWRLHDVLWSRAAILTACMDSPRSCVQVWPNRAGAKRRLAERWKQKGEARMKLELDK